MTQENPTSTMILNIMVDAVVKAVIDMVCIPQEAQHDMGWAAGERKLLFYGDQQD